MTYDEISNIKCAALGYAIRCAAGAELKEGTDFIASNPAKIVEAAKTFEAYISEATNAKT